MSADLNILLRRRVEKRCAELGISRRQALKRAGLAHDTLARVAPRYGHRLDTLAKLAEALNWDLPRLLATEDERPARKRRRDRCVACGGKLANWLTCWTNGGHAELPLHLDCAQSITTALMVRTGAETRLRPATNGTAHTGSHTDISVQEGGNR